MTRPEVDCALRSCEIRHGLHPGEEPPDASCSGHPTPQGIPSPLVPTEPMRSERHKRVGSHRIGGFGENRRGYWKSVMRSAGSAGSDVFAMTVPLIAIVGVPMPLAPGAAGVFGVIEVTYFM